ncbi:MAG: type IV pilus secretin PilQ [Desulfobacterium sp.]|nr:type IV pilus secretin PilQ [Desulfobacterium sp.]
MAIKKGVCLLFIAALVYGCAAQEQVVGIAGIESPSEKSTEKSPLLAAVQPTIKSIELEQTPETMVVNIVANRSLTYTSVKQSFPLGVAVYLPGAALADDVRSTTLQGTGQISSIVAAYADQGMKTARVDILLSENLDYEVNAHVAGLTLVFQKEKDSGPEDVADISGTVEDSGIHGPESSMAGAQSIAAIDKTPPPFIPKGPASLTGLFFSNDDHGNSELFVKTSQPVKYDMAKDGDRRLMLKLHEVDIPAHQRRPLVTTYFKSAVERIVPSQRSQGHSASTIGIEMREQVPFHMAQTQEGIFLTFEPSTLEPPTFDLARREVSSEEIILTGKQGKVASSPGVESSPDQDQIQAKYLEQEQAIEPGPKPGYFDEKIYTGEKIRLDFFDTDIKNVFRILRSVSGKNFAVDKDVTGSVTMTLEKPVPWDQVLDLVLKMNRLGQVQEGTIVRIATLSTLSQEQKLNQDAVAAHRATLEQKKSLEPLMTEYIPINYSSAETDVKPHLEKILTPDRGVLSVDGRTNMIILTDVREKIDQAKELIRRLDKVTPQIMISARVVEVNKNFSKALGINWGTKRESGPRENNRGSYDFNVAMNYPVASQGTSLGFDFKNIFGTSAELNATLTASEIKGDVKIISSPKILTLDNKKAKIKQGLEYAYLERDDSGGSAVKFKSIDLLLEVTPHVTPDHRIAMSVLITKNDLASVVDGVPSLSTNEAETELLVNDGNTIVIGGIVKNTTSASENGFPGLSNIPFLGRFFGSDSTEDKKNELLIFITPTIVQLEQRGN